VGVIIMESEKLNLPGKLKEKFKGKKVELLETKDGILIKPLEDIIKEARGFLKGSSFNSAKYMKIKKKEKKLEK